MLCRYFAILVFISAFIQGCAALPSPEIMAREAGEFELPAKAEPGYALVYVVRPSLIPIARATVFLDGEGENSMMGYTSGSQYIYFYVPAGTHRILSVAAGYRIEIIIDAEEGDIIFLKQDIGKAYLLVTELNGVEGRYHLKNSSLGTIINIRK